MVLPPRALISNGHHLSWTGAELFGEGVTRASLCLQSFAGGLTHCRGDIPMTGFFLSEPRTPALEGKAKCEGGGMRGTMGKATVHLRGSCGE